MNDTLSNKPKIGIMAVGLGAYWPQFPGMREGILNAHARLSKLFAGEAELIAVGLVDSADSSRRAGELFAREQVDMIACHLATYANSETLLPAVGAIDVPVMLLNVQPVKALDFARIGTTADWLGVACTSASLPEMTAVLIRMGRRFATITGHLEDDAELQGRIRLWCKVAGILKRLRTRSLALLGRPFAGMMDLYIDETALFDKFGILTRHLDWEDAIAETQKARPEDRLVWADRLRATFEYPTTVTPRDIDSIAGTLCGLDRLVQKHALLGIATHFEGVPEGARAELLAALNPALSLLITDGIACPVEGDIKAAIAMVILKALAGSATLAELYSMDFNEDICIIGHSGAGDAAISAKRPTLAASEVFHGKSGKGYLTQFFPRTGAATLFACTQDASGGFMFVAAEGEIVEGPVLNLGDTNCRVKFSCGLKDFMERWSSHGPTHHSVIGIGKHIDSLKCVATALGITLKEVCR